MDDKKLLQVAQKGRFFAGLPLAAKWVVISGVLIFCTSPLWFPLLSSPERPSAPGDDASVSLMCHPEPCRLGLVVQQGVELHPYSGSYSARSGWSEWYIEVDGVGVRQRVEVPSGEVYGFVDRVKGTISMSN